MCRFILVDKTVHDKRNKELHWTRVKLKIMHNYAQLCTIIQISQNCELCTIMHNYARLSKLAKIVNYAQLCTIMHVHNPPPPRLQCGSTGPLPPFRAVPHSDGLCVLVNMS